MSARLADGSAGALKKWDGIPVDFEKYLEKREEAIRERMRALAERRRAVTD